MGFTPAYQKDPLAPIKLKPGLYAQVYLESKDPTRDVMAGGRVWFHITEVDADDGTWVGVLTKRPGFSCGVERGVPVRFTVEQAEQVTAEAP